MDFSIIQSAIDWSTVTRFTPSLFARYCQSPISEIDGFDSDAKYHTYWAALAQSLVQSSKAKIGRWQSNGMNAAQAVESNSAPVTTIFDFEGALASEPLPIANAMVQEKIALLASNPPLPQAERQQESQTKQVAAINELMDMTLDGTDYKAFAAECIHDIQYWKTAIARWNIDPFQPGLFGEMGKITLEKCDIQDIYWDPQCKKLHCDYMDYVIQKHTMEIGEIQAQYPLSAYIVPPDGTEMISETTPTSRNAEDYIQSPQPKLARDVAAGRQKITVLEMWIKDSRMMFEPIVLNATSPYYEDRFQMDEQGYIVGNWVKRYPTGRQIIVTQAGVLKDLPNPYPHGQFPYVFARGGPSNGPCAAGNATQILIVTRKINALIRDIMTYFQSEIKRPMMQTPGAILDPNLAQNIPNDPSYVLEIAQNGRLERRPPVDVPSSVYAFLQMLQQILDLVSGSTGIMRGILEEGDQLSAEAVSQLNQFASSRLALESSYFRVAMKQLFYQLMWLLRVTVKSNIKVQVQLPTGEQQVVDWKSDRDVFARGNPWEIQALRAKEDYLIKIKPGTGAPGAQAQQHAMFSQLYKEGAIDRKAYLDGIQFPGRDDIVSRIRSQELEDLYSKGVGRAVGLSLNDILKAGDTISAGAKGKLAA